MILLYTLILIPLAAAFIADWSGVFQSLKIRLYGPNWWKISWKPLDCAKCLSFWLTVLFLSLNREWNTLTWVLPFASSALAVILKKITKL